MQCLQEKEDRNQGKEAKDRKIRSFSENQMEKFHQIHKTGFVGDMPSLIDQLKFQPVDPVITAHSNAAGRNPGQETEDGEFRHSIARLLSVRPGRHQIPGGISTKGASAGQIFCRIVTIFYQKTECYGNSCQYDIHQCALLHVEPPFFMAFFPKSRLSSSCLPDAVTHPLSGLLQAYLCAQHALMRI